MDLLFAIILKTKYHYPNFTDEEVDIQKKQLGQDPIEKEMVKLESEPVWA